MNVLELFAGAGGLALGVSRAGGRHRLVVERDADACATLRLNRVNAEAHKDDWPLAEADVRTIDFAKLDQVDLVSGGPPCQPFSIGGKHRGMGDSRNLFPEVVRAVRETRPKAILVENVRGLLRPQFASFFNYVLLQLAFPEIASWPHEHWESHLARLEKLQTKGERHGLTYNVLFRCLNSADYGVPQKRHRVFIVGFRSDLGIRWSFPETTHTQDALIHSKFVSGEYWDEYKIPKKQRQQPSPSLARKIEMLKGNLFPPSASRWLTVRDALNGLPEPVIGGTGRFFNHLLNPGAKPYPGHTGSPLDEPAKTLKAGDHGVPGGENMLAYPDGGVRYFTVRESARIQTFPDDYPIAGSWTEAMRQIGNAVPVKLAEVMARSIGSQLS